MFAHLFSVGKIGKMQTKNRIYGDKSFNANVASQNGISPFMAPGPAAAWV